MKKGRWVLLSLVLLVIICAGVAGFILSRPQGNELMASVDISASEKGDLGVGPDSTFQITTKYHVDEESLRAILQIEPQLNYTLTGSARAWTITPTTPLAENTVYTIQVINPTTKAIVRSFAFQTRSDLAVNQVYPAADATYVPAESGIEFTFNATGVDISQHFEIKPEIAGTFETNDYTAIFKPTEPLALGNIYRVTLQAGLSAPNGMILQKPYQFTFETQNPKQAEQEYRRLQLSGDYAETFLQGDPLAIHLRTASDLSGQKFEIKLHKYSDISGYMKELRDHDVYYAERYGERTEYVANTTGLEEAASFSGELIKENEYGNEVFATLPDDLPEGHYIVTISGKDAEGTDQFVQKLIQIRNLSVYTQSVDGDTLIWVNDPVSGEPVSGAVLQLESVNGETQQTAVTQADGTARLMTGENEEIYLAIIREMKTTYFEKTTLSKQTDAPITEKFYTAVYTDREIYQPDDTIRFWGVVKPRGASALPETVYATVSTSWPASEVYRVKADVAADGTYSGEIPITGLGKNWYTFDITDGNEGNYSSKSLSVERYRKPAYQITVKTDREVYNFTDPVTFQLSAAYFDGTPAAGTKLDFDGGYLPQQTVTLDAAGKATFTIKLDAEQYRENMGAGSSNWMPQTIWYNVTNADAENVQINATGSFIALPSIYVAQTESDSPDKVTVRTAVLDRTKIGEKSDIQPLGGMIYDPFDALKGGTADLPVQVSVHRRVITQIPDGSYYDFVNKRTVTRYRTESSESVVATFNGTTAGGSFTLQNLPYQNDENTFYWFSAELNGGVIGKVSASQQVHWRGYPQKEGDNRYTFVNPQDESARKPVARGETITLGLYCNGEKVHNKGRMLYSAIQRKSLSNVVTQESEVSLKMEDSYLPNVIFAGAYFDGRHIYPIEARDIAFDYSEKELSVKIQPDKDAYKPGDTAQISLTVTDAQGKPAAGSAVIGVVDEAVFAIQEQELDLAGQLYARIFYPYIAQRASYIESSFDKAVPNTAADAGIMTGGGGESAGKYLRETFLDTAIFQTITVDATGKAVVAVKLPDNVTAWRVTAAAVTPNLQAGAAISDAVASLPFYLTPLFSNAYLVGDDLVAAVGAVGTGIKPTDSVNYSLAILDAENREIDRATQSGTAGERVSFNLGKYEAGHYKMVLTGTCGTFTDSIQQEFSVLKSAATLPVLKNLPLSEVSKLVSTNYPLRLTVYDSRMKPYMEGIETLSRQSGERTEVFAAAYLAQVRYQELLDPADRVEIRKDPRLDQIQDAEEGGVRILPVSGSDSAVTAKLLVAAPELVNRAAAKEYLENLLKDATATPNDRVMSYLGLAAAGEPILLDIQKMLQSNPNLTVSQQLYLGAALAKLGDFTGANAIYTAPGKQIVTEGNLKYIEVGGSLDERVQNTAAALMLTSLAGNPDADGFMRFMSTLDTDRAKTKVLGNLEMLTYLTSYKMPAGESAAKFSYIANGEKQEHSLAERGFYSFAMSYETFVSANLTGSKDVFACVSYSDYAENVAVSNDKIKITKTYKPIGTDRIGLGGQVQVNIKVEFSPDAPDGCYHLTDYIPAGMRWIDADLMGTGYGDRGWLWANAENEGAVVRGTIYRDHKIYQQYVAESAPPAFDKPPVSEQEKIIPVTDSIACDSPAGEPDPNLYTFTYYVSAVLPGTFVTESAYLTPFQVGISAKSERSTVTIDRTPALPTPEKSAEPVPAPVPESALEVVYLEDPPKSAPHAKPKPLDGSDKITPPVTG